MRNIEMLSIFVLKWRCACAAQQHPAEFHDSMMRATSPDTLFTAEAKSRNQEQTKPFPLRYECNLDYPRRPYDNDDSKVIHYEVSL